MSIAITAMPSGIIQKPRMGRKPKNPPMTSAIPRSVRTPGGTFLLMRADHLSQNLCNCLVTGLFAVRFLSFSFNPHSDRHGVKIGCRGTSDKAVYRKITRLGTPLRL